MSVRSVTITEGIKPHLKQRAFLDSPARFCLAFAGSQCVAGDAVVGLNRAGKSYDERIERVVERFHGGGGYGKKWDPEIATQIRFGTQEGAVRLTEIVGAQFSGRKALLRIEHAGGILRVSNDHRVLTSQGWVRAHELRPGDELMRDVGLLVRDLKPIKSYRTCFIPHPFSNKKGFRNGVQREGVYKHRIVMEAALNGLSFVEFCERLRAREWEGLKFLRSDEIVHHVDGDIWNNDATNLELTDRVTHSTQHGVEGAWKHVTAHLGPSIVSRIQDDGEHDTFDLEVAADEHNFLADGVVVHNSGKTIAAAAKVLMRILNDCARPGPPKRLYWVVDPTYELAKFPQAYLVHYAKEWGVKFKLDGWLGSAGVFSQMRIWAHGAFAVIEFKSAAIPDRLRSASVQGVWMNEAALLKDDTWSGNLRSRLIATGGWAIADSTPMGENWVYHEFYLPGLRRDADMWGDYEADKASSEFETFTWESADNPAVDRSMLEHAQKTMPEWAFAREWKGNPHHFAGQLFPHWLDSKNVMRIEHTDYPELEIGLDFGFGPGHPFVILVAGVDFDRRRYGIIHEEVHEGMLFDDQVNLFANVCRRFPRVEHVVGDSADPGMLALLRARRPDDVNVSIRPAYKMGVRDGTAAQGELIGDGNYLVHPNCKVSIRQHKSARWKPVHVGKPYGPVTEEPERKNDDTVAASRYIVHPRLPRTTRPQAKAA